MTYLLTYLQRQRYDSVSTNIKNVINKNIIDDKSKKLMNKGDN